MSGTFPIQQSSVARRAIIVAILSFWIPFFSLSNSLNRGLIWFFSHSVNSVSVFRPNFCLFSSFFVGIGIPAYCVFFSKYYRYISMKKTYCFCFSLFSLWLHQLTFIDFSDGCIQMLFSFWEPFEFIFNNIFCFSRWLWMPCWLFLGLEELLSFLAFNQCYHMSIKNFDLWHLINNFKAIVWFFCERISK